MISLSTDDYYIFILHAFICGVIVGAAVVILLVKL